MKVVDQTSVQSITKQDGTTLAKCTLVLQELGGKYENSYAATLIGNLAGCRFYPGDTVVASLRFQTREYQSQYYTDITVQDIIKFNTQTTF
ncbi:MAG: DUF3127 domain-containing protein [Bacteroidales bacterium]|nr:DUF3127 domain-containing protein [Bacteroidales bacterium]